MEGTSTILKNAEAIGGIDAVIGGLTDAWQDGGAVGVAKAWGRGGAAKVGDLDTAFASKFAYFACYDRGTGSGPLIADNNTAWAVWALTGIEGSLKNADAYGRDTSSGPKSELANSVVAPTTLSGRCSSSGQM